MENTKHQLQVVYGDGSLGVLSDRVKYLFSYERGGLESLTIDGKEWLYRVPKPLFWRATTDNDRGNHFSEKSAMWLGADLFSACDEIAVAIDGQPIELPIAPVNNQYSNHETADSVAITFTYLTPTVPQTKVEINYQVTADGRLQLTANYHGQAGLPQLPAFGIKLVMPTPAVSFEYQGLSGETYPDRMDGANAGNYQTVGMPVTPYLVPQECGMHMQTDSLTVNRRSTLNNADADAQEFSLMINQNGNPFAFSCLPYTTEELENATHHEELPAKRRTVLSILGAVRGVGGIDSWGAEVEPQFQLAADQDYSVSVEIGPQV